MSDSIPPRAEVVVAGGSIGGLCAGLALLSEGYDVHVFERSTQRLSSRGAGIVVQPDLLELLELSSAPRLATTSCSTRQTVSKSVGATQTQRMAQRFTSWEAIYSSLLAAFPNQRLHTGVELSVEQTQAGVIAHAPGTSIETELFVAADGFRSPTRAHFAPETYQRYAGYIAWRGVIDEFDLPEDLVAFFDDRFSFCPTEDGGHALCYLIPGEGGATTPGARSLNWVWYVNADEGSELDELLTDTDGHRRSASVPAGSVNEKALSGLRARTPRLEKHFARLVDATPTPFIQAILDIAPPAMSFGRICLLGDAAFVIRPHTAAATAKAAADAIALARSLRLSGADFERGLSNWEGQRMAVGRHLVDYGVALGQRAAKPSPRAL
ncbi:MAG: FAD-dependent monooxygenase [Myxococcota bacterium]